LSTIILDNIRKTEYSEVSPDWLRYELPKLGIAGSNPALRMYACIQRVRM
jgi:hypothetical protein